jgi:hypothetical protein
MCSIPFSYVKDEKMKVEARTTTVDQFKNDMPFRKINLRTARQ